MTDDMTEKLRDALTSDDPDDLRDYYAKLYGADRMSTCVVTAVDAAKAAHAIGVAEERERCVGVCSEFARLREERRKVNDHVAAITARSLAAVLDPSPASARETS